MSSYPKVYNLGHKAIQDLFKGEVHVQEKVDGSQGSIFVQDGELYIRSKRRGVPVDTPDKLFNGFSLTAQRLFEEGKLEEGVTYRGEVVSSNKHNILTYGRVPPGNFVLFDVDRGDQCYVGPEELKDIAAGLGLECVPTLFVGEITSRDQLDEFLELESFLGNETLEGVVIKNYNRFARDGKALMGKIVRKAFRERHKSSTPKVSVVDTIIQQYRTDARWNKAIQHLRDDGELEGEPRDIGKLMKELHIDFEEECSEEVGQMLWEHYRKQILRGISSGFPEYYKDLLTDSQFDD